MKVSVGVSRRHVHLTKETYLKLFGNDKLEVRNYLNQKGQFASTSTVDLKCNNKIIEHVRIVGPFRDYNQVELSDEECEILNVNPPRRQSGDLNESLPITIIGPLKEVDLDSGLIRAEMHVHMPLNTAEKLKLKDKEVVDIYKNNKFVLKAKVKVSKDAYLELHIDTEEEKIYDLHKDDEVELKLCGK